MHFVGTLKDACRFCWGFTERICLIESATVSTFPIGKLLKCGNTIDISSVLGCPGYVDVVLRKVTADRFGSMHILNCLTLMIMFPSSLHVSLVIVAPLFSFEV